jgi:hypothetical protein
MVALLTVHIETFQLQLFAERYRIRNSGAQPMPASWGACTGVYPFSIRFMHCLAVVMPRFMTMGSVETS